MSVLRVSLAIAGVVTVALFALSETRQQPPPTSDEGIPYFNVNINPTPVPPEVNINPRGAPPTVRIDSGRRVLVEVEQMPEVRVEPRGCADARGFETGVGREVSGPMVLTYLSLGENAQATLEVSGSGIDVGDHLRNRAVLGTMIHLGRGEELTFSEDVLYSGCRPE